MEDNLILEQLDRLEDLLSDIASRLDTLTEPLAILVDHLTAPTATTVWEPEVLLNQLLAALQAPTSATSTASDPPAAELWQNVLHALSTRLPKPAYQCYFAGTTAHLTHDILIIRVPEHAIDQLTTKFRPLINRALFDNGYTGKWTIRISDDLPLPAVSGALPETAQLGIDV